MGKKQGILGDWDLTLLSSVFKAHGFELSQGRKVTEFMK